MAEVYIGLGSNLGDRLGNLARAREALANAGVEIGAASSIYETAPWGPVAQGAYLNQAVRGTTALAPRPLLAKLRAIETELGRDRDNEIRFGPRTIDLDILLYDSLKLADPDLKIPHPRMLERAFVLVPLTEIAPDIRVGNAAARDVLARIGRAGVVRYEGQDGAPVGA